MSVVRRYLIAPSLVRLIRKERGGSRITEGYFAPQAGRTSYVRIDGQECHLVLVTTDAAGLSKEERTEVPRAHGDALLDVCAGKAAYERTLVALGGRDVEIDRYLTPPGLDIASVTFDDDAAAKAFVVPAWFGKDVSAENGYDRHAVAIQGVPAAGETGLTNAALNAVLDLIEPRFGFGNTPPRRPPGADTPVPPPAPVEAPPAPRPAAPAAVAETAKPAADAPKPVAEPPKPAPAPPAAKPAEAAAPAAAPPAPAAEVKPPAPPVPVAAPAPVAAAKVEPAPEAPKPPVPVAAAPPEPPKPVPAEAAADDKSDARIDDVIESLSQALSAAIQQPKEPAREDDLGASFERWTVRPRRTNQQN